LGADGLTDIEFSEAQAEESDAFAAITRLTFQEHSQRLPDEFPAADSQNVERMITTHFATRKAPPPGPFTRIVSAKSGGMVIGYALLLFYFRERNADSYELCATVYDISLLPDYRGRGIGKRLLSECVATMRSVGATKAKADVWRDNTASAALFRSQAWSEVNTTFVQRIGPPIQGSMPKIKPPRLPVSRDWGLIIFGVFLGLIAFG
jgi:ribosomal protein S18 acetylase RimI-like enzyme